MASSMMMIASPALGAPVAAPPNVREPGGGGRGLRGRGEDEALSKKLNEINQKLRDVVAERKKLSPLTSHPPVGKRKESSATDQQQGQLKKGGVKSPKKRIHHPNLDVILTEISLSPYLTSPDKNYSKKTIKLPSLLRDLRERDLQTSNSSTATWASLLDQKELSQMKKTLREVMHYKHQFDSPLPAPSCSSQQGPGVRGMKRRLPSIANTNGTILHESSGPQPVDTHELVTSL